MQTTIKYKILELKTVTRKSDDESVTIVVATNENNQEAHFFDLYLPSMRLGDELEIRIKNNE